MADFHQTGVVSTLHRLGATNLERLEKDLLSFADERPVALVLPCHVNEISRPALVRIVDELQSVPYLRQVVVSLSGEADREHYQATRALFQDVHTLDGGSVTVVWSHGPRVQKLLTRLREEGLDPGLDGKGRANWLAFGYVLAANVSRVVATHDCDIRDYDRELLARLCFPTANPNLGYEFAKGYYSRVTDRLHGRVTRL